MPRYAQLVVGPAGSGKSTYCSTIAKHCEATGRTVHVVNLDPAAEYFDYPVLADVRDLIQLDDVMEDDALRFGPNGGLVFCMEYLVENLDWLHEQLDDMEDDYIIFDCPGQVELYTHIPVMKLIVEALQNWTFNVAGIFILDAQFMIEASKFVSGVMCALSTMVNLEIPHLNVMTKVDLLDKNSKKEMERFLEPDLSDLLSDEFGKNHMSTKYSKLNEDLAQMIDDYSLVKFLPLDRTDEESIINTLLQIDNAIQYGEDLEPKEPKDEELEDGDNEMLDYLANR